MTDPDRPAATVIIPAWRAGAGLRRCVDSVLAQELDRPFELIVVVSGDGPDELADAEHLRGAAESVAFLTVDAAEPGPWEPEGLGTARLRVVAHRPRLSAAQARNFAMSWAKGDVLAFTDADATAEAGWLAALCRGVSGGDCAIGAVVNGTPRSRSGTTEYLVEFLDLHPGRPPETVWHGATVNLAMTREMWEQRGPFRVPRKGLAAVESSDTLFTLAVAAEGRLRFVPDAQVTHFNRTTLRAVARHQFGLGRNMAALARRAPTLPHREMVARTWAAPAIAAGRFVSVWRRVAGWRIGMGRRTFALTGHLVVVLGAWGLGLAVGNREMRAEDAPGPDQRARP